MREHLLPEAGALRAGLHEPRGAVSDPQAHRCALQHGLHGQRRTEKRRAGGGGDPCTRGRFRGARCGGPDRALAACVCLLDARLWPWARSQEDWPLPPPIGGWRGYRRGEVAPVVLRALLPLRHGGSWHGLSAERRPACGRDGRCVGSQGLGGVRPRVLAHADRPSALEVLGLRVGLRVRHADRHRPRHALHEHRRHCLAERHERGVHRTLQWHLPAGLSHGVVAKGVGRGGAQAQGLCWPDGGLPRDEHPGDLVLTSAASCFSMIAA
mmetsp:Transcript_88842/g.231879  ORF Transcript_88842/g.231879 Transcript_88842/m.231879 type:complete len:268 (-) Transcript_88842:46-849(-)